MLQIPSGVWALGFVSLLMDLSSEMVHSLLPMFMVGTLGASALTVGIIKGLAESTALIVKVFSGVLSDYWGKRKSLALVPLVMVADTAPADLRGTAYGFFNLMCGITMLLASVTAGWMWEGFGAASTFYAGAAFCVQALAVLASAGSRLQAA